MKLLGLVFIGLYPLHSVFHYTEKDRFKFVRLYKSPDKVTGTKSYFMQEVLNGRLHGLVVCF